MIFEVIEDTEKPGSDVQIPESHQPASTKDYVSLIPPEITKSLYCRLRPPEDVLVPASEYSWDDIAPPYVHHNTKTPPSEAHMNITFINLPYWFKILAEPSSLTIFD